MCSVCGLPRHRYHILCQDCSWVVAEYPVSGSHRGRLLDAFRQMTPHQVRFFVKRQRELFAGPPCFPRFPYRYRPNDVA